MTSIPTPKPLGKTRVDRVRTPGYHPDSVMDELKLRAQRTRSGIAKSWVLRVQIYGQDTHLGLGSYPAVSQEEARRRAWAAQDDIAAGRDPRRRNDPTVQQVGDKIIAERSSSEKIWASESIRKRWLHNTLTHIYPKIGSLRLKDLRPVDIMECVVPLIREHPETARQVFSHLRVICKRAVAENLRGDDPTEAVAAALGPIHPRRRNRPMPALPPQQVAEALQRVRESGAHPVHQGRVPDDGLQRDPTERSPGTPLGRDRPRRNPNSHPGPSNQNETTLRGSHERPDAGCPRRRPGTHRRGWVGVPLRHGTAHLPRHARQTAEKPRSVLCAAWVAQQLPDVHERARRP